MTAIKNNLVFNRPITSTLFIVSIVLAIIACYASYHWVLGEHYYHKTQAVRGGVNGVSNNELRSQYINNSLYYNPYRHETLLLAAKVSVENHDLDKAIHYLIKSLEASPYQASALLSLSQAYLGKGNIDGQIETLERCIAVDNKNVLAYAALSHAYTQQGNTQKANDAYQEMKMNFVYFKGRDQFGPYYAEVGKAAEERGDYGYAKYVFSEAISDFPDNALYYKNLGILYYYHPRDRSESDQAIKMFQHALRLNPQISQNKILRKAIVQYRKQ